MENTEPILSVRAPRPIVTVLLFAAILAALVTSGSYFSKQRSVARELSAEWSVPAGGMGIIGR